MGKSCSARKPAFCEGDSSVSVCESSARKAFVCIVQKFMLEIHIFVWCWQIPAASRSKTWHAPCASGVAWKHLDTVGRSDTHWQSVLDAHVTWLSSEQAFSAMSDSTSASSDEGSSSSATSLCHRTIKLSDTSFLIQRASNVVKSDVLVEARVFFKSCHFCVLCGAFVTTGIFWVSV